MLNNVNNMQTDPQVRPGMNVGPGSFANGMPPRSTPNPANDSGVAANGLPRATTNQGRAIQEASLVMPRQKFSEIIGSIYRNSRKTEIPNHIIENRPLDLYALFTTVAKFGGCAEVSSLDALHASESYTNCLTGLLERYLVDGRWSDGLRA